jgi:hypothetical protein
MRKGWVIATALALGACTTGTPDAGSSFATQAAASSTDPGALVRLDMTSTVGVLLDEIPDGALRDAAAADALAKGNSFWTERAMRQAKLTYYRLVFRALYYPADWSSNQHTKGPLPLPPKSVWHVDLAGTPHRAKLNGRDMVVVDYTFRTHILTDVASPGTVEPNLAKVGGTWSESFNLPTDPELLLERTGYACMDEDEYPPGSVFEENPYYFFDDTCHPEGTGARSCHITQFPTESCVESMGKHTGIVKTGVQFTRLAWDAKLAKQVRVGTITNANGADLAVVKEDIEDEHRTMFRFFSPGSCELEEGVIAKLGWRRLLAFSATVRNDGAGMIHMGDVTDPNNPWQLAHVFEFSPCHHHYHFSHYGVFGYGGAPGSKRAFCLEDTNRFHNDEFTPLAAIHQSCQFQGITRGWGDEYEFGIPGQWVDITDVDVSKPYPLTFDSNPDRFLCEGKPVTDASGNLVFDPTDFRDAQGNVVSRLRCDAPTTWHDNNQGAVDVSTPSGSFVTEACTRGQIGPKRDCGFTDSGALHTCTPGSTVTLTCSTAGAAQVVRVCERSEALGVGVACTLADSAANTLLASGAPTQVTFACPAVRDSAAGTGGYSVYGAPVLPSQGAAAITCTGW